MNNPITRGVDRTPTPTRQQERAESSSPHARVAGRSFTQILRRQSRTGGADNDGGNATGRAEEQRGQQSQGQAGVRQDTRASPESQQTGDPRPARNRPLADRDPGIGSSRGAAAASTSVAASTSKGGTSFESGNVSGFTAAYNANLARRAPHRRPDAGNAQQTRQGAAPPSYESVRAVAPGAASAPPRYRPPGAAGSVSAEPPPYQSDGNQPTGAPLVATHEPHRLQFRVTNGELRNLALEGRFRTGGRARANDQIFQVRRSFLGLASRDALMAYQSSTPKRFIAVRPGGDGSLYALTDDRIVRRIVQNQDSPNVGGFENYNPHADDHPLSCLGSGVVRLPENTVDFFIGSEDQLVFIQDKSSTFRRHVTVSVATLPPEPRSARAVRNRPADDNEFPLDLEQFADHPLGSYDSETHLVAAFEDSFTGRVRGVDNVGNQWAFNRRNISLNIPAWEMVVPAWNEPAGDPIDVRQLPGIWVNDRLRIMSRNRLESAVQDDDGRVWALDRHRDIWQFRSNEDNPDAGRWAYWGPADRSTTALGVRNGQLVGINASGEFLANPTNYLESVAGATGPRNG